MARNRRNISAGKKSFSLFLDSHDKTYTTLDQKRRIESFYEALNKLSEPEPLKKYTDIARCVKLLAAVANRKIEEAEIKLIKEEIVALKKDYRKKHREFDQIDPKVSCLVLTKIKQLTIENQFDNREIQNLINEYVQDSIELDVELFYGDAMNKYYISKYLEKNINFDELDLNSEEKEIKEKKEALEERLKQYQNNINSERIDNIKLIFSEIQGLIDKLKKIQNIKDTQSVEQIKQLIQHYNQLKKDFRSNKEELLEGLSMLNSMFDSIEEEQQKELEAARLKREKKEAEEQEKLEAQKQQKIQNIKQEAKYILQNFQYVKSIAQARGELHKDKFESITKAEEAVVKFLEIVAEEEISSEKIDNLNQLLRSLNIEEVTLEKIYNSKIIETLCEKIRKSLVIPYRDYRTLFKGEESFLIQEKNMEKLINTLRDFNDKQAIDGNETRQLNYFSILIKRKYEDVVENSLYAFRASKKKVDALEDITKKIKEKVDSSEFESLIQKYQEYKEKISQNKFLGDMSTFDAGTPYPDSDEFEELRQLFDEIKLLYQKLFSIKNLTTESEDGSGWAYNLLKSQNVTKAELECWAQEFRYEMYELSRWSLIHDNETTDLDLPSALTFAQEKINSENKQAKDKGNLDAAGISQKIQKIFKGDVNFPKMIFTNANLYQPKHIQNNGDMLKLIQTRLDRCSTIQLYQIKAELEKQINNMRATLKEMIESGTITQEQLGTIEKSLGTNSTSLSEIEISDSIKNYLIPTLNSMSLVRDKLKSVQSDSTIHESDIELKKIKEKLNAELESNRKQFEKYLRERKKQINELFDALEISIPQSMKCINDYEYVKYFIENWRTLFIDTLRAKGINAHPIVEFAESLIQEQLSWLSYEEYRNERYVERYFENVFANKFDYLNSEFRAESEKIQELQSWKKAVGEIELDNVEEDILDELISLNTDAISGFTPTRVTKGTVGQFFESLGVLKKISEQVTQEAEKTNFQNIQSLLDSLSILDEDSRFKKLRDDASSLLMYYKTLVNKSSANSAHNVFSGLLHDLQQREFKGAYEEYKKNKQKLLELKTKALEVQIKDPEYATSMSEINSEIESLKKSINAFNRSHESRFDVYNISIKEKIVNQNKVHKLLEAINDQQNVEERRKLEEKLSDAIKSIASSYSIPIGENLLDELAQLTQRIKKIQQEQQEKTIEMGRNLQSLKHNLDQAQDTIRQLEASKLEYLKQFASEKDQLAQQVLELKRQIKELKLANQSIKSEQRSESSLKQRIQQAQQQLQMLQAVQYTEAEKHRTALEEWTRKIESLKFENQQAAEKYAKDLELQKALIGEERQIHEGFLSDKQRELETLQAQLEVSDALASSSQRETQEVQEKLRQLQAAQAAQVEEHRGELKVLAKQTEALKSAKEKADEEVKVLRETIEESQRVLKEKEAALAKLEECLEALRSQLQAGKEVSEGHSESLKKQEEARAQAVKDLQMARQEFLKQNTAFQSKLDEAQEANKALEAAKNKELEALKAEHTAQLASATQAVRQSLVDQHKGEVDKLTTEIEKLKEANKTLQREKQQAAEEHATALAAQEASIEAERKEQAEALKHATTEVATLKEKVRKSAEELKEKEKAVAAVREQLAQLNARLDLSEGTRTAREGELMKSVDLQKDIKRLEEEIEKLKRQLKAAHDRETILKTRLQEPRRLLQTEKKQIKERERKDEAEEIEEFAESSYPPITPALERAFKIGRKKGTTAAKLLKDRTVAFETVMLSQKQHIDNIQGLISEYDKVYDRDGNDKKNAEDKVENWKVFCQKKDSKKKYEENAAAHYKDQAQQFKVQGFDQIEFEGFQSSANKKGYKLKKNDTYLYEATDMGSKTKYQVLDKSDQAMHLALEGIHRETMLDFHKALQARQENTEFRPEPITLTINDCGGNKALEYYLALRTMCLNIERRAKEEDLETTFGNPFLTIQLNEKIVEKFTRAQKELYEEITTRFEKRINLPTPEPDADRAVQEKQDREAIAKLHEKISRPTSQKNQQSSR